MVLDRSAREHDTLGDLAVPHTVCDERQHLEFRGVKPAALFRVATRGPRGTWRASPAATMVPPRTRAAAEPSA